jgi:methyl-accepting chemotaxis protein
MERQMYLFSGKLEGLDIGRQEVLNATEMFQQQSSQLTYQQDTLATLAMQQDELADRFVQHERLIREALKFCTAGLEETSKTTGNTVKLAKVKDDARQIIPHYRDVTQRGCGRNRG